MTHHLGYEKHSPEGRNSGNSRSGRSRKTLKGKHGEIPIEVPRDRNEEFDLFANLFASVLLYIALDRVFNKGLD